MSRVRSKLIAVVLLFVVLPLSYVSAYFALLDTSQCSGFAGWRGPRYRVGGRSAAAVFAPLAWLDVSVRPDYWDARANPGGQ
jgi:hypothetical protein